jgi:transposase-like protein
MISSKRCAGPKACSAVHCDGKRVSKYVKQASTRERFSRKSGQMETKAVPARILYVCLDCKKQFSVTEGTIFNDTHLSLEKWFHAVALMVNAKKGLSAMQLQRDLKTAYRTSWYLGMRIRKAMGLIELADDLPLTGTIEVDETLMGAKKYDKRRKRGPHQKEPVFGMVERDGRAKTYHMPHLNRHTIMPKIEDEISIQADAVYTDDSKFYKNRTSGRTMAVWPTLSRSQGRIRSRHQGVSKHEADAAIGYTAQA